MSDLLEVRFRVWAENEAALWAEVDKRLVDFGIERAESVRVEASPVGYAVGGEPILWEGDVVAITRRETGVESRT